MIINKGNIALVHDWFVAKSLGGAEKVTLMIDEYLSSKYSVPDLFSLTENISKNNVSLLNLRCLLNHVSLLNIGSLFIKLFILFIS